MRSYARLIVLGGLVAGCTGDPIEEPIRWTIGDGSIRLEEDGSANLELVVETNATQVEYQIVDQPQLGQLIGTGNQYEYVANDDVNGTDTFTWKALDKDGNESEIATVTVFIEPVNDGPTGTAKLFSTDEDTPVSGQLPADDVEGDTLTFVLVSSPENGRVDLGTDGSFTYTPDRNYVGSDSFLWSALDPAGATTGPVRVDINIGQLNDAPVVEASTFTLAEDAPFNGQLVGTDADGDSLTWSIVTPPVNGNLDFNPSLGTFTYRPNQNFFGTDSFEVSASDGVEDSAITRINLTVTAVNDRPTVVATTLNTDEDTALDSAISASDVEGQTLTYRVDSPPRNGIVSLDSSSGAFTYTPGRNFSGLDDFTVIANDGFNDSLPGRITVAVNEINDAPTLVSVGLVSTVEDGTATGQVTGIDVEGDPLTYSVFTPPANGTVTLSATTGSFAYVPSLDFAGNDSFEIVVSDGQATSAPTVITVVVIPANDAPRVSPTTLAIVAGQVGTVTLQAVDPEGASLFFVVSDAPDFGTATLNSVTGEVTYTPNPGYVGPDLLRYTVSDGDLTTPGFLTITVAADGDGDEVGDQFDNCPDVANADQSDIDGNGRGDRCDCISEAFGPDLNPEFVASSLLVSNVPNPNTSPTHALRFNGAGSFIETVAQPGCIDYGFDFQLATGNPAPEISDSLVVSVSTDGGPFTSVYEAFGTGAQETFARVRGTTTGVNVSGNEVVFRIEVIADESDDLFIIDDLSIGCDTDADLLLDCVESGLPGYDLQAADADNDGLLDSAEYELGTDPNNADSDFDAITDDVDNCPLDFNPGQDDIDGNGFGDACEAGIAEDFDAGSANPDFWTTTAPVGDGEITTAGPFSGTHTMRLSHGDGASLESLPIDFTQCSSVAWDFRLQAGADYPYVGETFSFDILQGGQWQHLYSREGNYYSDAEYRPVLGNDPALVTDSATLRFFTNDYLYSTGQHDWFIDDIYVGCDADDDMIPNEKEVAVYGTNPIDPNTDGDGLMDGEEIIAGTDPLIPDAEIANDAEPNNSPAEADVNNAYLVSAPTTYFVLDGDMLTSTDTDYYRVETTQPFVWNLEVSDGPSGAYMCQNYSLDSRLYIYDSAGVQLAFSEDLYGTKGYCSGLFNQSYAAGVYYVRVDRWPGTVWDYTLTLDFQ